MEPVPVMRYHLEFLASRLAWSRLLPGLALIGVGLTQPFAVIEGDNDVLVGDLTVGGVIGRSDTLANGAVASGFGVLLIAASLALAAQSLNALTHRTERARRVTVALAIAVLVCGLMAIVAVGAVEPLVAAPGDSLTRDDGLSVALTAQGPIPLLLGVVAVWVAASRAKRPERFLERTVSL